MKAKKEGVSRGQLSEVVRHKVANRQAGGRKVRGHIRKWASKRK